MPTCGSLAAAINFDLSGTTKINKYILNPIHDPGLVATLSLSWWISSSRN
jgi:anaerobic C4-dicarboxylate transporter DcuA